MKVIKIFSVVALFATWIAMYAHANAVDCEPTFNRNYTVEGNCTWPGAYKVYGDIIVADKVVTIETGDVVGIDLSTNKVTFTTGRMDFSGDGKMDNSVSARYYVTLSFTNSSTVTSCPAGYEVLNTTPDDYQGATITSLSPTWSLYCGK